MKLNRLIGCLSLLVAPVAQAGDFSFDLKQAPESGTFGYLLFDSPEGFNGFRKPVRAAHLSLEELKVFKLSNLPPGRYVLALYLDENENGRLDRNFLGIPREPIGFSNGYRPKGPPLFSRAALELGEGESQQILFDLERPLGERGRISFGAGVVASSSPYAGSNDSPAQVIPAITYIGSRVQILGPRAQVGLFNTGKTALGLVGRFQIGAYEEDDSPLLMGLGDRDNTFLMGLAFEQQFAGGLDVGLEWVYDVLDRNDGGSRARLSLKKSYELGVFRLGPSIAVNLLDDATTEYDFGVSEDAATDQRSSYEPGVAINPEVGIQSFIELSRDWQIILQVGVEWLDSEIRNSPLVDEDVLFKGFGALNYTF